MSYWDAYLFECEQNTVFLDRLVVEVTDPDHAVDGFDATMECLFIAL